MTNKLVAWSHSALSTFKTCPKKYYHEKIKKDVVFNETEAMADGKAIHKAFELYVAKGKELPFGMAHYKKFLDKFVAAPGQKLVEQKMAINRSLEPTGYFDKDVWFRGQADLLIINDSHAVVIDYKTGKLRDSFDQLELMAACTFCLDPNIQTITAVFFWTKDKVITSENYKREQARDIWGKYIPQADKLALAVATTDFPARPNFLCKRYCDVTTCPHHGE